ncbi:MAG: DUF4115 domain-containing protein, partial [Magnetococcus sp. DMHC-8]
YLHALETGEVEKLPGATFVAGFLRLYAETLELADRSFIERYLETSGNDDSLHTDLLPAPVTLRHRPSVLMVLGGTVGLLVLFFVYENHFSSFSNAFRSPEPPATMPLRAGSMPTGGAVRDADPSGPNLADEEEKGVFNSGLLSRFFNRPAGQKWEADDEEGSRPPAAIKPGRPGENRKEQTVDDRSKSGQTAPVPAVVPPRKSTRAPEPVDRVDRPAPGPTEASARRSATERAEEAPPDGAGWLTALVERVRGWFDPAPRSTVGETPPGAGSAPSTSPLPTAKKDDSGAAGKSPSARTEPPDRFPGKPGMADTSPKPVSVEPPAKPMVSAVRPVEPSPKPVSVEPPVKPAVPAAKPVEPPVKPVSVEPPVKPAVSAARPVEPPVKPVEPPAKPVSVDPPVKPAVSAARPVEPPVKPVEPPVKPVSVEPSVRPAVKESGDPATVIANRYQEKVSGSADLRPEAEQAVSLLANELVWVQIQDEQGRILKDMVMQPNHLFRVPMGGRFVATLGSAGGVRLRVGNRELPYLGKAGEELGGVELTAESLLRRAKP